MACADDNVARLRPAAKIVATSAFIPFLLLFVCICFFVWRGSKPPWLASLPFGAQFGDVSTIGLRHNDRNIVSPQIESSTLLGGSVRPILQV
jgi:hypothetical protein